MRRPATYPGYLKEAVWGALNLTVYPVGLVADALKVEDAVRLGDRYSRALPLRYVSPEAASTPIILLHGLFHNRSAFLLMRRMLRRVGYRTVDTMNYNVIGNDVEELAGQLAAHVEHVLASAEATQVHLIGHSLGGLVARYYIQELGGHEKVHTCVTLGTPHQGSYAAWIGRGKAARQLRPGSDLLTSLSATARRLPVRFVSFYSNLDGMVLPPSNAKLVDLELRARNILVKDVGHISLLISRQIIRSIAGILSSLDDPNAIVEPLPRRAAARTRRPPSAGAGPSASSLDG